MPVFDKIQARDPANPNDIASNATIVLFDTADPEKTPVALTKMDGTALANPYTVNRQGEGPAFQHETLYIVGWEGGGRSGVFHSIESMHADTLAARTAAENSVLLAQDAQAAATNAGATAGAEAAAVAKIETEAALADANAAIAASAQAAADAAALVDAPAGTVVRSTVEADLDTPSSGIATRISSTYASVKVKEAPYPVSKSGAVGDGVTDDRSALLAAQTIAAGGELLFIPGKNYRVVGTLGLESNTRYIGHGATITEAGTSSPVAILGKTNTTVEGLTVDGAQLTSAAFGCENNTGVKLRGLTIKGGKDYGLYHFACTDSDLQALTATANGDGGVSDAGYYLNGTDIRARGLMAKDNAGHGYRLHGNSTSQGRRVNLDGCHAVSNDLHGFVGASSGGTQFAPLYVSLNGCQAHENGTGGTYSGFSLHYLNRMSATGLITVGNAEHGLVLMDQEKALVSGIHAEDNAKAGIRLQSDFAMAQNSRSGVRNSVIEGGLLAGNWTANTSDSANYGAIQIDGTRKARITGLEIIGTRGVAVRIDDPANYTDSSDLELQFTSYDNTLGHYGNAQPAGGIYGSYRTTAGVTTIG